MGGHDPDGSEADDGSEHAAHQHIGERTVGRERDPYVTWSGSWRSPLSSPLKTILSLQMESCRSLRIPAVAFATRQKVRETGFWPLSGRTSAPPGLPRSAVVDSADTGQVPRVGGIFRHARLAWPGLLFATFARGAGKRDGAASSQGAAQFAQGDRRVRGPLPRGDRADRAALRLEALRPGRADSRLSRCRRRRVLPDARRGARHHLFLGRQGRELSRIGRRRDFRRVSGDRRGVALGKRGSAHQLHDRLDVRGVVPGIAAVRARARACPAAAADQDHPGADDAGLRVQHFGRQQPHPGRIAAAGEPRAQGRQERPHRAGADPCRDREPGQHPSRGRHPRAQSPVPNWDYRAARRHLAGEGHRSPGRDGPRRYRRVGIGPFSRLARELCDC